MTRPAPSRRDEMLREMGIGPRWQLRGAAAVTGAEAPVTSAPAAGVPLPRPAAVPGPGWEELKARVASCTACGLHAKRNRTVFGVGDEQADWLFIGEGPGAEEDAQGEPFVGQAGKLLDNMLASINLGRGSKVYIANIVKCRPPGNRNPEAEEAQACSSHLQRQIELIRPRLIVALGKVAAVNLLGRDASIAALRGQVHEHRGIPLIVTYHPAYLLRTLNDKAKAWQDLCFAVDTMRGLQSAARTSAD
ncbi:MAG: uracil-DNA glycosylase [Burkholderiales bacterium]|nr:uracil-DNA glycosylase [Burkholderiales bacterium]